MSRVKRFTPGPWEAGGSCVSRPNGEIVACFVSGNVCRGNSLEDYETARLIAAAPDLLESLEEARDTIQAVIDEGYLGYVDQRSRIDAAIAKAYGEEA